MFLCEKDDIALAAKIIDRYNIIKIAELGNRALTDEETDKLETLEEEITEQCDKLYAEDGEEPDALEVPVEMFHRMAAEVEHHKAMLAGSGAGVVLTLGASTTGHATYGIAKDIDIAYRVRLRAPEGHELTEEEIDKMVLAAVDGFRATLLVEANTLKEEVQVVRERFKDIN